MKLSSKEIHFGYGEKNILNGVDLSVEGHKFVGIIGPNGSGKTTFLKLLYRALKPRGGTVFFEQKPIHQYTLKQTAKKMAVVGQHNFYEFDFSVLEIVLMGRSPHKKMMEYDSDEDFNIAEESLKKVNIYEYRERNFNSLSGGEQQRVILARALTQQPEVLLLDEPTNHLDIKYQLELLSIIKNLGIEVIAALHDLNLAAAYCDEIVALYQGGVYAQGTPKEVFTKEVIRTLYGVEASIFPMKENRFQIVYEGVV